jgi:hypothetical protein
MQKSENVSGGQYIPGTGSVRCFGKGISADEMLDLRL